MKFCIPTAITCMALSFCSAAVDVALRGSVAHENNLIAPLVTDLKTGIICASYAIKSVAHNTYIRARHDREVDTQTYVGSWERFTFQDLGSGLYSIKSVAHGTFLRANKYVAQSYEPPNISTETFVGSYEKFKLESENGAVSFLSTHGSYVSAEPGGEGSDVVTQTYSGSWEKFELVCLV